MGEAPRKGETTFRGIPVSVGVCRGTVVVVGRTKPSLPRYTVTEDEFPGQIHRLEEALVATRHQILRVQEKVSQAMGAADASIFDAHLLVLEDHTLLDEVTRRMREENVNVEFAFHEVAEKYAVTLGSIDDEYLRERAADMRDVTARVLQNLVGASNEADLQHLTEASIIVSHDLTPSTTAMLDKSKVLGFATDAGSRTSHTAIMARSLQIPAVVGLRDISETLETGQDVLLDGYNGIIVVNPTDQTLFEYGQLVRKKVHLREHLLELKDKAAVTLDGCQITLSANLEQPDDVDQVRVNGAAGVGLFRTEYLFINRQTMPDEEEQFRAYKQVAEAVYPQPLIIRTLDLGGDKFVSPMKLAPEMNPFLGWRAIRFCLQETEIFRAQLRAILRASVVGNVKMMYPMICRVEELEEANELLGRYRDELRCDSIPVADSMEVGAMIETPSAVMIADLLAKRVQFFSIGTNDLIQYALAVDRLNERIAHLYEPTHPGIIRLLKRTIDAAHEAGLWVGVCGEMAGDPALVPLLLGLGVDELSATASIVPQIKFMIRRLKISECRDLAARAIDCDSGARILKWSEDRAREVAPVFFENGNA